jgi:putative ABC transport system permease protein
VHSPPSLAWRQLARERRRMLVAVFGVSFAVLLILMQLGFKEALYASTVLLHDRLNCDLVLLAPQTSFIGTLQQFSHRRLFQALSTPGVASASPLYIDVTYGWRTDQAPEMRAIYVIGFDLTERPLEMPEVNAQIEKLQRPDVVLFDALSRKEYGPIPEAVARNGSVPAELNGRRITVVGVFPLGTSFAVDGTVITSDANFLRILPQRRQGLIDIGLIRVRPGEDPERVRERLVRALPDDVLVLTREAYTRKEVAYWAGATPIGFVFAFGSVMGFIVGAVIVYQVLFAGVQDHLAEYATLKALGFTSAYVALVVMSEAVILAVLGFLPGAVLSWQLYRMTSAATRLPMTLSPDLALSVLALAVVMCSVSGLFAVRRLRSADPADIFR